MPRYTAWKTVIDGAEKTHRGQKATYDFLYETAVGHPDGVKASVYVQESGSDHWSPYEQFIVRGGTLTEA